jgi:hypothetical protein
MAASTRRGRLRVARTIQPSGVAAVRQSLVLRCAIDTRHQGREGPIRCVHVLLAPADASRLASSLRSAFRWSARADPLRDPP